MDVKYLHEYAKVPSFLDLKKIEYKKKIQVKLFKILKNKIKG